MHWSSGLEHSRGSSLTVRQCGAGKAVGICVRMMMMMMKVSSLFPAAAPALFCSFDDGSGGAESHGADGATGHLFTRNLPVDF